MNRNQHLSLLFNSLNNILIVIITVIIHEINKVKKQANFAFTNLSPLLLTTENSKMCSNLSFTRLVQS